MTHPTVPDPNVIEAFIPLPCTAKGNSKSIKQFGRFKRLVDPDHVVEAERTLTYLAMEHRPAVPFAGAVRLDVRFVRRVPEGFADWKRAAALAGTLWPTTKPDRGNLLKLLEDALQHAGWYQDDARVVAGEVSKVYGEREGYILKLTRLVEAVKPARVSKPRKPKAAASSDAIVPDVEPQRWFDGERWSDEPARGLPPPEAMNGFSDQFPGEDYP